MKIFPTRNYKIELIDSPEKSIELLKSKTLESDSLSTKSTDKEFIGRIHESRFEIINSKVGIGAFTVLRGHFSGDSVHIVAEINKPFKVLISIMFIAAISGIAYNGFKFGFPKALGLLAPLIMLLGLFRFVFLGSFFKRSLDLVFGKFTSLLNLNQFKDEYKEDEIN